MYLHYISLLPAVVHFRISALAFSLFFNVTPNCSL